LRLGFDRLAGVLFEEPLQCVFEVLGIAQVVAVHHDDEPQLGIGSGVRL
jgi:hypothetical protein